MGALEKSLRLRSLITETANLRKLLDEEKRQMDETVKVIDLLEKKRQQLQDKVNQLDLAISDNVRETVDLLAVMVRDRIADVYDQAADEFYDKQGSVDLREQEVFEQALDHLLDEYEYEGDREAIRDWVWEKLDHSVFTAAEVALVERYHDAQAYHRDPLGYHGLSQSDFLVG